MSGFSNRFASSFKELCHLMGMTCQRKIRCAKEMWDWEYDNPFNVVIYEAKRPRFSCSGFYGWVHGRNPAEHFRLEDERRTFQHQRRLAWLSFWGALIGAIIGAAVVLWLRS